MLDMGERTVWIRTNLLKAAMRTKQSLYRLPALLA